MLARAVFILTSRWTQLLRRNIKMGEKGAKVIATFLNRSITCSGEHHCELSRRLIAYPMP
jgi:guanylate kinase